MGVGLERILSRNSSASKVLEATRYWLPRLAPPPSPLSSRFLSTSSIQWIAPHSSRTKTDNHLDPEFSGQTNQAVDFDSNPVLSDQVSRRNVPSHPPPSPTLRKARQSHAIPANAPTRPRSYAEANTRHQLPDDTARSSGLLTPPSRHSSLVWPEDHIQILHPTSVQVRNRPDLVPTAQDPYPFWFTTPQIDARERKREGQPVQAEARTPRTPPKRDSIYPFSRAAEVLAGSPPLPLFRARLIALAQSKKAQPVPIQLVRDVQQRGPMETIGSPSQELSPRFFDWAHAKASHYSPQDLIATVMSAAQAGNIDMARIAHQLLRNLIRDRQNEVAAELDVRPEEVPIHHLGIPFKPELFESLLLLFAFEGSSMDARMTLADMHLAGYEPTLFDLNAALRAAARSADEAFAIELLHQMAQIPSRKPQLPAKEPKDTSMQAPSSTPTLFHPALVANWTPDTMNSLFLLCITIDNLEYALALIGLATQRSRAENNFPQSVAKWIPAPIRNALMGMMFDAREPGLAYDVLELLLQSFGPQVIPRDSWAMLLDSFTDQEFHPGIHLSWKTMMTLEIDVSEEACTKILEVCSRTGEVRMAERAFGYIVSLRAARGNTVLVLEWHVTPLFLAYTRAGQWESAFLALAMARQLGIDTKAEAEKNILRELDCLYGNELDCKLDEFHPKSEREEFRTQMVNRAIEALIQVGQYPCPKGGVDPRAVNGILAALRHTQDPSRASNVLQKFKQLYAAVSKRDANPKHPPFFSPDIDSYNAALITAVECSDWNAAKSILADTVTTQRAAKPDAPPHPMAPSSSTSSASSSDDLPYFGGSVGARTTWNSITYERLINLALRLHDTERAMNMYRAARRRGIQLTYPTMISLIMFMKQNHSSGWFPLLKQMKRQGFPQPKKQYLDALGVKSDQWFELGRDHPHYQITSQQKKQDWYHDELY